MDVTSPDTTTNAYNSLVNFGVVGAILAIVLMSCIALVWYTLITSRRREADMMNECNERLRLKDAVIESIQEKRALMAEKAATAIAEANVRLEQVIQLLEQLVNTER